MDSIPPSGSSGIPPKRPSQKKEEHYDTFRSMPEVSAQPLPVDLKPQPKQSWLSWAVELVLTPVTYPLKRLGVMSPSKPCEAVPKEVERAPATPELRTFLGKSKQREDISEDGEPVPDIPEIVPMPLLNGAQPLPTCSCHTGLASLDRTGFVNASLKALMAAYPPEFFEVLRMSPAPSQEQEAVRQAFLNLLDIIQGKQAPRSEEAVAELTELFAAIHEYDRMHGREVFNSVFNKDGTLQTPINAYDFLAELMRILNLNDLPQTSGQIVYSTLLDPAKLGGKLPECLAHGIPAPDYAPGNQAMGGVVVLPVTPGDDTQTVQSCLNKVFAPQLPGKGKGEEFYVTTSQLKQMGYKQGDNRHIDQQLKGATENAQIHLPVVAKAQPRLQVDIDSFTTFSVSLNVCGGSNGRELVLPGEAEVITGQSGEYITVPVTDSRTGQHYLIKMRQKTVCSIDETMGQYCAGVREGDQWRTHKDDKVKPNMSSAAGKLNGRPHSVHVLFYEKVGEPIPVPHAGVLSLDQNVVDMARLTDTEKYRARQIELMTGKLPKAFRENEGDILMTDLSSSDRLAGNDSDLRLYRHLKGKRQDGQLLVQNEAEFIVLYSGIPKAVRQDQQNMERLLRLFRRYQKYTPHPDCLPSSVFAHLVNKEMLCEGVCFSPEASKAQRRKEEQLSFSTGVENAQAEVRDFPGVVILDRNLEQARQRKISLAAPGVGNFGNTCFMDSTLVALSDSLHRSGDLDRLRDQTIPFTVARDMIRLVYPKPVYPAGASDEVKAAIENERQEAIDQGTRDAIADRGDYAARFFKFKEYYVFRNAFVSLMDAMHPDSNERPVSPQLVQYFFQSYHRFSQCSQRAVARDIFGEGRSDNISLTNITQGDPTEFMGELCSLLGIDNHPDSAIVAPSILQMVDKDGKVLLQRPVGRAEYSSDMKMEITGMAKPDLEGLCERFLTSEIVEHRWTEDDYALAGVKKEDRGDIKTRKNLVLTYEGAQPPRRLMVSPKMFDMNFPGKTRLQPDGTLKEIPESEVQYGDSYKTVEEAKALIRETDITQCVKLPFIRLPDPGASIRDGGDTVEEDYSVKSILCHSGRSPRGGHYINIRFDNGKTTIYDDSAVFDLSEAHVFHGEKVPYKDWKDYLLRTDRYPYMFTLEASLPEYPGRALTGTDSLEDDDEAYVLAPETPLVGTTPPPLSPEITPVPTPLLTPEPGPAPSTPGSDGELLTPTAQNVFVVPVTSMNTPPVMVEHCKLSPEQATDPVAKMNYRLFAALSSAPLVEGVSEKEDWGRWLWRMAMTYEDYTPPKRLVRSEQEFVRLFKYVPAKLRLKPREMVVAVRRFKQMMAETPSISPGMFPHMLSRGDLDPVKGPVNREVDLGAIRAASDMPVVDPGALGGAGPIRFFPGFDSGHVDSAMQCSLHLMAGAFKNKEQLEQVGSQPIPAHVLRELAVAELTAEELAEGDELIERKVAELQESRGRLGARKEEIERPYINFQTDFANLMQEMTAPVPGDSLTYMYQGFLESYKALCAATGRPVPAVIREGRDPALSQPLPHELMAQMMDLLGMHNNPVYALKASEHFSLSDDDEVKYQKPGQKFQGAALPLPLPSSVRNPSLQSMVLDCAGQTEMVKVVSGGIWTEDDRRLKGISEQDIREMKTRRSVTFECLGKKPPEHLLMNIEAPASGGFSGSTMKEQFSSLIFRQIHTVMSNTYVDVPVCIPLKNSEGDTAVINYVVQDIVCKREDSAGKAHYLTLQFRSGKAYICDGPVVIELKDYVAPNGKRAKHTDWMQFCDAEHLQICSVTLGRDPASRGFEEWHKEGSYESEVEQGRNEFQMRLNDIREQRRLAAEAAKKRELQAKIEGAGEDGIEPIQIELIENPPVRKAERPGFKNLGATCYANAGLVCLMEGMSDQQLAGIQERIKDMPLNAEKMVARGFLNLARLYQANAPYQEVRQHLKDLFRACHFLGRAQHLLAPEASPVFYSFFPSATSYNARVQDSHEFLTALMDVLRLNNDPSCCVSEQSEFASQIAGVTITKPEYSDPNNRKPDRHAVVVVPVLTAEETRFETTAKITGMTVAQVREQAGVQGSEEAPELQKLVDDISFAEKMSGENKVRWLLDDYKGIGNYDQASKAVPDIDSHFSERYYGAECLHLPSTKRMVYSADLDKLESLMVQYKIFDNSLKKRTARCRSLKQDFPQDITMKMRNTADGQFYDVTLRPVSVAAHSGGVNIAGGHFIGYTSREDKGQWVTHDDNNVYDGRDLKDISADPYIVNYKVVGKELSEEKSEASLSPDVLASLRAIQTQRPGS